MTKKYKNKCTGDIVELVEPGYYYKLESNPECLFPVNIVKDRDDWEEIVEQLYEILEYKSEHGIWYRSPDIEGDAIMYCLYRENSDARSTEDHMLRHPEHYQIHKVKRLSDNSIWTIGDTIIHSNMYPNDSPFTIGNFQKGLPVYGDIWANEGNEKGQLNIRFWKHIPVVEEPKIRHLDIHTYLTDTQWIQVKEHLSTIAGKDIIDTIPGTQLPKVLLTTEDGISYISDDEIVYGVRIETYHIDSELWESTRMVVAAARQIRGYKWFSTENARDKFIIENKAVLSLKGILTVLHLTHESIRQLKEEIKKKLNMK